MTVYYAIGDVHGEKAKLDDLLAQIASDVGGADHRIVFIGDLIDRGAESRTVVETAMRRNAQEGAIVIRGNHEELMLHAYERDETIGLYHGAMNGGDETIASYKAVNGSADHWRDAIDAAHVNWMRNLPTMHRDQERGLVFVHGGIDPKAFPNDSDELRMWTRSERFFKSSRWPDREELKNILVVHGHTPTEDFEPDVQPRRINVDTGACFGGPLTAVVLAPGERPRFLHAR
ncbi:MAG: serine/threonine protein phosphatase [Proteobacteria bacterium]|nr:serine/threonine protein phosphatase [Pseudomonadota bacterium]